MLLIKPSLENTNGPIPSGLKQQNRSQQGAVNVVRLESVKKPQAGSFSLNPNESFFIWHCMTRRQILKRVQEDSSSDKYRESSIGYKPLELP